MSEQEFQITTLQALARDNYQCVVCTSKDHLDVHHVKKTNGLGIDHSVDNLS